MPKRRYKKRVVRRKRTTRSRRRNMSPAAKRNLQRIKRRKPRKSGTKAYRRPKVVKKRTSTKKRTARTKVKSTRRRKGGRSKASYRAAGRKAARTRKRRAASRKRSYKKSRKTTRRKSTKRSRVMKRVWAKRKRGAYKVKRGKRRYRKLYRTKRGRAYKRAYKKRGRFVRWKNQVKGWAMGIGLGGVALYLSELLTGFAQKKAEEKGYAGKLQVAGTNILPIALPLAISLGMMKYGNKVIKNANVRTTVSMAFGMAGILAALNKFIVPKLPSGVQSVASNMSGYVVKNGMRGYVRSGMRGYVKSMGAMPTSRMLSPGTMRGLPTASFGSGSGLQVERRTYDKYQWGGVLSKNVFED